ncbi:hypothetical protein LH935_16390 [Gordonia polyisoprenivorans]|uniref:hypothetical protein n=1 Tax=Gordonia polyisoprenivorans TaxID=84595 RepID=UPI0019FDACD2|nr:hypothetical protein [Gordonia polyisoprenivorans]UZF54326.1 hypothetical protein LH935_16390 [Gordonia polyisoprenivorans]
MTADPADIAAQLSTLLARVEEQGIEITPTEHAAIEGAIEALRRVADPDGCT